MMLLGIISLIQVVFLPGFLCLVLIRYNFQGILKTLLLSFGLSLVINYWLVLVLTTFHQYTSFNIYCVLWFEIFLLLYASKVSLKEIPSKIARINFFQIDLNKYPVSYQQELRFPKFLAIVTILCLAYYYIFLDLNPKSIFSLWDAVVSWNFWATQWFQNTFASQTREYPQLLPINISLTYKFIGYDFVQVFGRFIFYLFPVIIIGCFWDMAKRQCNASYFWAIVFFGIFLKIIFGPLAVSGFADVPVACMVLLGLYPLISLPDNVDQRELKKNILVGALIVGAAAVTKQAGIYLALTYPALVYWLLASKCKDQDINKTICQSALIILFYVSPWYVYKFIQFHVGLDSTAVKYLLSGAAYTQADTSLYGRFVVSFKQLHSLFNSFYLKAVIPLLIVVAWLNDRFSRIIISILIMPMFFIWVFCFSYDVRNIAFIIPFLSMVMGFGLHFLIINLRIWLNKLVSVIYGVNLTQGSRVVLAETKNIENYAVIAFVCILSFIGLYKLNLIYDLNDLVNQQVILQKQLGNRQIDSLIYGYFNSHPILGMILSNNLYIQHLPTLNNYFVYDGFNSLPQMLQDVKEYDGKYLFFIEQNVSNQSISTMPVEQYLASHKAQFKEIFHVDKYWFYKVN